MINDMHNVIHYVVQGFNFFGSIMVCGGMSSDVDTDLNFFLLWLYERFDMCRGHSSKLHCALHAICEC